MADVIPFAGVTGDITIVHDIEGVRVWVNGDLKRHIKPNKIPKDSAKFINELWKDYGVSGVVKKVKTGKVDGQ